MLAPDVGEPSIIDNISDAKKGNLLMLLNNAAKNGKDTIAELGSSYPKSMDDQCPCLTATRKLG